MIPAGAGVNVTQSEFVWFPRVAPAASAEMVTDDAGSSGDDDGDGHEDSDGDGDEDSGSDGDEDGGAAVVASGSVKVRLLCVYDGGGDAEEGALGVLKRKQGLRVLFSTGSYRLLDCMQNKTGAFVWTTVCV